VNKTVQRVGSWVRRSTRSVYENNWITVCHDEVLTPAGSEGIYGRVCFKNIAVGIIPLDEDRNNWLVG